MQKCPTIQEQSKKNPDFQLRPDALLVNIKITQSKIY